MEAIKRSALKGKPGLKEITPEDLRYKTWDLTFKYESNAVVLAMMDTSGSMGPFEKYIARSFFFWMVRFLRTKYNNVQIVFLAHHTEARETTEEEFFTKGASGEPAAPRSINWPWRSSKSATAPRTTISMPFTFPMGITWPRTMKTASSRSISCSRYATWWDTEKLRVPIIIPAPCARLSNVFRTKSLPALPSGTKAASTRP